MTVQLGPVQVTFAGDIGQLERSLASASRALDGFGRRAERLGRTLTVAVSAPLAGIGASAAKAASDLDVSMSRIVGLVGVAADQVAQWRDELIKLGPAVGRTPQELGDALYYVTSAGLRGAEALEVVRASAMAAAAGLGDTKVVADAATSAMNAYGAENLSAEQAVSVLVATIREGKLAPEELAGAIGRVIPVATQMGVSFDQVGAAIAAMSRTGLNAHEAVTGLRALLVSILNPSAQARQTMGELGISLEELRRRIRDNGLLDGLTYMAQGIGDNTDALGEVIPNVRALVPFLSMLGSQGEKTREIFDSLARTTSGDFNAAFEAFDETAAGAAARMKGELGAALTELGDAILPHLVPVVEAVAGAVSGLADWFDGLSDTGKDVVVALGAVAAAAGPVLMVGGKLAGLLSTLVVKMGGAAAAASKLSTAVAVVGAAYAGWKVGRWISDVTGLTEATSRLGDSTAEMASVVAASEERWRQLVDSTRRLMDKLGVSVADLGITVETLRDRNEDNAAALLRANEQLVRMAREARVAGAAADALSDNTEGAAEAADGLATGAESAGKEVEDLRAEIRDGIQALQAMAPALEAAASDTDEFGDAAEDAQEQANLLAGAMEEAERHADSLAGAMQDAASDASDAGDEAGELVGNVDALADAVDGLPPWPIPTVEELGGLNDATESIYRTLQDVAGLIGQGVFDALSGDLDAVRDLGSQIGDALLAGLADILNTGLFDVLNNAILGNMGGLKGLAEKLASVIKDAFAGKLTGLGKLGAGLAGLGIAFAGHQAGGAGGALMGALGGALAGAQLGSIVPGIGTAVGAIVGGIVGLLGGIFGGSENPPHPNVQVAWRPGVGASVTGTDLPGGFSVQQTQAAVYQVIAKTQEGFLNAISAFGDASLFALADLSNMLINWSGSPAADDLQRTINDLLRYYLPGQVQNAVAGAIYEGFYDLGFSQAWVDNLFRTLGMYDVDARVQILQQVIQAAVGIARVIQGVSWGELTSAARASEWERFGEYMGSIFDQIELLQARMGAEVDIAGVAGDVQAIAQLIAEAGQSIVEWIQAVDQVRQSIAERVAAAKENLLLGGMDPAEQMEYVLGRIGELLDVIASSADLSEIAGSADALFDYIQRLQALFEQMGVDLYAPLGDLASMLPGATPDMTAADYLAMLYDQVQGYADEATQGILDTLQEFADQLQGAGEDTQAAFADFNAAAAAATTQTTDMGAAASSAAFGLGMAASAATRLAVALDDLTAAAGGGAGSEAVVEAAEQSGGSGATPTVATTVNVRGSVAPLLDVMVGTVAESLNPALG